MYPVESGSQSIVKIKSISLYFHFLPDPNELIDKYIVLVITVILVITAVLKSRDKLQVLLSSGETRADQVAPTKYGQSKCRRFVSKGHN